MTHRGTATFIVKAKFTITKDSFGWDEEPDRDDIENEMFSVGNSLDIADKSSGTVSWIEDAELVDVEWKDATDER